MIRVLLHESVERLEIVAPRGGAVYSVDGRNLLRRLAPGEIWRGPERRQERGNGRAAPAGGSRDRSFLRLHGRPSAAAERDRAGRRRDKTSPPAGGVRLPSVVRVRAVDGIVQVNGRRFRGELQVTFVGRVARVINLVDLESYVRGVVAFEIGGLAPIEAQKAQAVIARTYAMANRGKHGALDADVCAREHCQVYGGMAAERPASDQAVHGTRGVIMISEGQAISTLYHATCGGLTNDNGKVWGGTQLPYLRRVSCPFCREGTNFRWRRSIAVGELVSAMQRAGHAVGRIRSVRVRSAAPLDRAEKVTVLTDRGEVTVNGTAFRSWFGLPSTCFLVADPDAPPGSWPRTPLVTRPPVASGPARQPVGPVIPVGSGVSSPAFAVAGPDRVTSEPERWSSAIGPGRDGRVSRVSHRVERASPTIGAGSQVPPSPSAGGTEDEPRTIPDDQYTVVPDQEDGVVIEEVGGDAHPATSPPFATPTRAGSTPGEGAVAGLASEGDRAVAPNAVLPSTGQRPAVEARIGGERSIVPTACLALGSLGRLQRVPGSREDWVVVTGGGRCRIDPTQPVNTTAGRLPDDPRVPDGRRPSPAAASGDDGVTGRSVAGTDPIRATTPSVPAPNRSPAPPPQPVAPVADPRRAGSGTGRRIDGVSVAGVQLNQGPTATEGVPVRGAVLVEGRGYGHLVGLCQAGAIGMAKHGWQYRQILPYYYTGVMLRQLPY